MKHGRRLLALAAALLWLLCVRAGAAGNVDLRQDLSLRLTYCDERTPLSGAVFSVYRIADADETGELTALEDFSAFDLDIRGEHEKAWREMAATLESYVLRREITPVCRGKTDEDGRLTLPGKGKMLSAGLYLVIGERHEQGGFYYDAQPFLIMLPRQDLEQNEWVYRVEANVKFEKTPVPDTPETVTRRVLKIWDDEGAQAQRPKQITMELLKNGKVYDTVTLSEDNNWRYTWEDLDSSARWSALEQAPEGYTVRVRREGTTFVVTNTKKPQGAVAAPPGPRGTLPQTGALWWQVWALAAAGLVFLILGALDRKRSI